MKLWLFGTFHGAFWTIQSGSGPEFNKEFDFEVKKIGLRSENIILNEFAGKFGTHFLFIFSYFRIQIRRRRVFLQTTASEMFQNHQNLLGKVENGI